jgi:hypothetical protein
MTERKFTHPKDAEEGHKWQADDGRKVRIYTYDAGGRFPIHGAVWNPTRNEWVACVWNDGGGMNLSGNPGMIDLVDAPRMVKVEGYLSVARSGALTISATSDFPLRSNRVACIKIDMEVEEGRFDD